MKKIRDRIRELKLLEAPLIYKKRSPEEALHKYRTEFQRDRDRILYSRAFRRLNGKTQVFLPLSPMTRSAPAEAGDSIRETVEQNQQGAKDYVAKVTNNLKTQGIASRAVTVEGRAADEILSYTEKNNVDLIVMSTHGRSGVSRFFFGSVAEKVSRHSRVPVLLLAPEGCRNIAT